MKTKHKGTTAQRREKSEIRSTKSETNSKLKGRKLKTKETVTEAPFEFFVFLTFGFVSDFVLRISDFHHLACTGRLPV